MRSLLLAIDAGPYHTRSVRSLSKGQRIVARELVASGLIRRMPRTARFEARYVVTINGSYALATFESARDIDAEIYAMKRAAA